MFSTLTAYRKNFRTKKVSSNVQVLSIETLSNLDEHISEQMRYSGNSVDIKCSKSIIRHINDIKYSLILCYACRVTVRHISFTLLQHLSCAFSSWQMDSLAYLLFQAIPVIRQAIARSKTISMCVASPQVLFPCYSSLHNIECAGRDTCVVLHQTNQYLKVILLL